MSLPLVDALQTLLIAETRDLDVRVRTSRLGYAARLLREPILHFFLLGALLYVASTLIAKPAPVARNTRVEVPAAEVRRLRDVWALQWHRPPTRQELKSLIDDYVREEVLYREAIAIGLDRNDDIVRRRLIQKMEFLTQNPATSKDRAEEGVD